MRYVVRYLYRWSMASKTISTSDIRRLAAELDCSLDTVRKVFRDGKPTAWPISKRIYEALIRDGFLDVNGVSK